MEIFADSGSTNTSWVVTENFEIQDFYRSKGLNPLHLSIENITNEIYDCFLNLQYKNKVTKIFFYGAGCINKDTNLKIKSALIKFFPKANIEIESDIKASSIALFNHKPGISCILGTGANVAFWDGTNNHQTTAPLGYILGDEGSGAYIGKQILQYYLRKKFSTELQLKLDKFLKLDFSQIIQTVYKSNESKKFIASLMLFAKENSDNEEINKIVNESFQLFVETFLINIEKIDEFQIGFCGSVAYHFKDNLEQIMSANNLKIHKVIKSPIFELIKYFKNN